jgi:phosphoribosylglycinamide formyltransferase-1
MALPRICIFASGAGTNAENIIRYFEEKKTADVVFVLSNKPDAKVFERAKALNVATFHFNREQFYESDLLVSMLQQFGITHLVLAGFLWQVPNYLIQAFPNRIINIHPSLLPKFGGKGMYGIKVHQAVKAASEKETGITIHEVNEHYDEGRILFQASCKILPSDTPEQISAKVQTLEYEFFPEVIEKWIVDISCV